MRRLWQWCLRSTMALVVLAVLLAVTVATILNTERGTHWALQRVDAVLPGELVIAGLAGTAWEGLQFSSLQYRDADREILASDAVIRVDWSGVVAGQLALSELRAATLKIRSYSEAAPDQAGLTLSMKPLPIVIAVANGEIGELIFTGSGEPKQIENISLHTTTVRGNRIAARAIAVSLSGVDIAAQDVRMTLAGDVPLSAQVAWGLADQGWSGQGQVQGSLALLNVEQSVAGPYPFALAGTVQILNQPEPVFAAAVNWQDWVLQDYGLPNGSAEFRGTRNDYKVDYSGTVITADKLEMQFAGSGSGDLQQLDEFAVELRTAFAAAEFSGSVSWLPNIAARAEFELSGLLEGAPITGRGSTELAPQFISCTRCELAVGSNKLRFDGQLRAGELNWSVSVDANDLHALRPDIGGLVRGDARLRGSLEQPRISGEVQAEQLAFGSWRAQSIAVELRDSTLVAAHVRARVVALQNGDANYGSFEIEGRGAPDDVQLELDWQVRGLRIDAAGALRRDGSTRVGRIERATINEPGTGDWKLQEAFAFRITDAGFTVDRHRWSGDSGQLQLVRLEVADDEIGIVADIERIPLSLADSFLPADFRLLGDASASIDVARRAGTWSGTLQWQQQDSVLRVIEGRDQSTDVRVPRAELRANFLDGGVVARASLSIEPRVSAELDLQLSALNTAANMQGELRLTGDDWSWITAVIPNTDGFAGSIAASLSASGPVLAPQLSGDLAWRNGRLVLPALNVPLENIDLVISGAPQGTATLAGSAKAGDGTLAITGRIDRLMQASRSLQLELTGKAAEMVNWPEYHVWGSPQLTIVGNAQGWQLSGDLVVPRAAIQVREIPVEATTVSADIVVLGAEEIRVEPTRIAGEVRLTLGNEVRIKALGLDTGLSGELLLRFRHDRPMSAEGRITLDNGSLEAQGQKLTIQKGELVFTGPLDNPILDVRAVRVIETFDSTVTAGIRLSGRAQDLSTTIFSEPAMNEVDALSYLVIGRPLSEATESEGGDLSGAAVSMGLRQATRLTDQIGQSLGLDQLSLSGDGGDSTMLIAGTRIGSRLYARYAYGIFSRLGTLLLRYKLSERVVLEAGAGEAQSIDILYSVER
ncbi:MAG: translocation/assembly module TamB domain-containing protein [Gammaproteobacteria bacterium]|nr:translocation/assembly module TamB domain-containing protein [Gammaproteobacteria bacterium]